MAAGIFVSGTDTAVGKTTVTVALAMALRDKGLTVAAVKPIETGCTVDGNVLTPSDALRLARSSSADTMPLCLYRFAPPVAPAIAADLAGNPIDVLRIFGALRQLESRVDVVLVEGAGGLMVPITDGVTMLSLAGLLGYPVLLVARSALGTVNHTVLSLMALRAQGMPIAGVVLNDSTGVAAPDQPHNAAAIAKLADVDLFGPVPFTEDQQALALPEALITHLTELLGPEK